MKLLGNRRAGTAVRLAVRVGLGLSLAASMALPSAKAAQPGARALPAGCGYEGPLGHVDVAGFANPARAAVETSSLTASERRILDMNDYAAMTLAKIDEVSPGFTGSPHVRSLAISSESNRRQADVEVTVEWRSGDSDDVSGRAVIGATKCGEGLGRLTVISVEYLPQDGGDGSAPIVAKPAAARPAVRFPPGFAASRSISGDGR